ncbi:hypothetical protein [Amycolatopsis sp. H20-H5]|uniref:hypothetical protein n=1 Tax=Amycolatopsis sp. H20-H5 TaxID=3046309 RepID=UPI002DB58D71|nr:hypothetical protein [Amycolatopsis sp. H20-H5]MEC3979019.1 hypothetical protein [Amycolatopsis sp. H20-H5]
MSDEPASERFDRALVGSVACSAYPYAPDGVIDLVADWLGWYYVFDDVLDDVLDGTPEGLDVGYVATVVHALSSVFENVAHRHPTPVVEACRVALTDLWHRSSVSIGISNTLMKSRHLPVTLLSHRERACIGRCAVPGTALS